MTLEKICENIIIPFHDTLTAAGAGYVEVIFREGSQFRSCYKKSLVTDFVYLTYEVLDKNLSMNRLTEMSHTGQQSKYQETIHCYVHPMFSFKTQSGYLVVQSAEPLAEINVSMTAALANVLNNLFKSSLEETKEKSAQPKPEKEEKFHNELMNIRDIQAKLFPSFDNINEIEIRSAYLPAELMSGTFIDGFFTDKSTYMLAACDVSDYGPASLFIGAAIRTIMRSEEFQRMIPSMMITTIENRIKNLTTGGNLANVYLSIYQLHLKTGRVVFSSYGPVTTLFYTAKKKGLIDLGDTEAGKIFAKRTFFRDLTITMDPGDTLLYYTRGVLRAKKPDDDAEYGLSNLKACTMESISGETMELVHSITGSVYEYTDYTPITEDIILISMKKT